MSGALNPILETAIEQRNSIGGVGLVGALWSGVWWMSNLREAVSAQWELPAPNPAALQRLLFDLRALAGLGAALVVTLAFTVLGTGLAELVLGWLGAPDDGFTRTFLRLVGIVLGVGANWLIFAWAITRLPRTDVALRGVRRAALLGAIGFEAIQQGAAIYFEVITGTPGGRSSDPCSACCSSATWWQGCCCGSRRGQPPRGATNASPPRPCRGRWCCARRSWRAARRPVGSAPRCCSGSRRASGCGAVPMSVFAATARARRSVADLLDGLDDAELARATCARAGA